MNVAIYISNIKGFIKYFEGVDVICILVDLVLILPQFAANKLGSQLSGKLTSMTLRD
jgi:hypothetical protein